MSVALLSHAERSKPKQISCKLKLSEKSNLQLGLEVLDWCLRQCYEAINCRTLIGRTGQSQSENPNSSNQFFNFYFRAAGLLAAKKHTNKSTDQSNRRIGTLLIKIRLENVKIAKWKTKPSKPNETQIIKTILDTLIFVNWASILSCIFKVED